MGSFNESFSKDNLSGEQVGLPLPCVDSTTAWTWPVLPFMILRKNLAAFIGISFPSISLPSAYLWQHIFLPFYLFLVLSVFVSGFRLSPVMRMGWGFIFFF